MTSVHAPSLVGASEFYRVADEFMNRLAETPQAEVPKLLAEYPEHAEQLERLLPAMQTLISFGREPAGASREDGTQLHAPLGDFQLIRELGRGGMGIVYEAEQISLGRRMAVKILPLASILDPRQLQRFRHEATACALLRHPNIVSIHSVGCERGVYFYAMELVDGQTLAEVIATRAGVVTANASRETVRAEFDTTARPADFFAEVARLGIQAAEALEHAHERGIVHRDIKPSNLMVDTSGRLWVTDFGLAHIESGPTLTITGDVLGTLRYMSPEQASGRPTMVDHRTDIYSLGATLYELASGSPVVTGQERASILREIAETDPASPRKLTPAMPVDLETILLKCLSKEPSVRYDTAQALAADLRRFLEHKPVVARRPTALDWVGKWSRRHRVLMNSILACSLIITTGATASALFIARAYQVMVQEARRADEQSALARIVVDDMYTRFARKWLARQPRMTAAEREFLDKALAFYERQSSEHPTSVEAQRGAAEALCNVAEIRRASGDVPAALAAIRRAVSLSEQLVATAPPDQRNLAVLADSLFQSSGIYMGMNQPHQAEREVQRALELYAQLESAAPQGTRWSSGVASARQNLGSLCLQLGKPLEAAEHLEAALRSYEDLAQHEPAKSVHREDLARARLNLATAHYTSGDTTLASEQFEKAIDTLRELASSRDATPEMRLLLSGALYQSVVTLTPAQMPLEHALARMRECVAIDESLTADYPELPQYRTSLRQSRNVLAKIEALVALENK